MSNDEFSGFSTPMMRQYGALKREHQGALLLYRCGDFYETYGEDANELGRLLNMIVTRKSAGADGDVAMSGFPYHALDQHLAKLVRLGKRVAIAEQMEDPKSAKGLVKREVVRVVTPGTAVEEALLQDRANNYIAGLHRMGDGRWGVALADISTGFFALAEMAEGDAEEELVTELTRLDAREILLAEGAEAEFLRPLVVEGDVVVTRRPDAEFTHARARRLLLEHFRVQSLEGFGAEELDAGTCAAGALLQYLRDTQRGAVRHIANLRVHHGRRCMVLDAVTQRSLELVRSLHGGREGTLAEVIDDTVTPMGARMLRGWILEPLRERDEIEARLDAVEEFTANMRLREEVGAALQPVRDMERIVGRTSLGRGSPRDLAALRAGLRAVPALRQALGASHAASLREIASDLDPLPGLRDLLDRALVDEPPANASDGGVIREGYSAELDEIKAVAKDSKTWIAEFRAREAERTGVEKLKVGFNRVFGYYIELTHAQVRTMPGGEAPEGYVRKQTLANSERYITPELKEKEDIILHAEERILALEARLLDEVRQETVAASSLILHDAELVARTDCLLSFARTALKRRYVRPSVNGDGILEIVEGRHPVLEAVRPEERFVPNDVLLDPQECQVALITGPNMAGKSTLIRQAALITLMAHMGCFVPAQSANVCLVDRIFTRVGATDYLTRGQSTFLVEMTETANILRNATSNSLVILDEIGRGTSTYDGLSIAWAVCEYLHNTPGRRPKTLFATHYHELTALEGPLPRVRNFHVAVLEEKERIVFLYKVAPGATDRSYGIHAAEFAGAPHGVVARAREILKGLERGEPVAPRVNAEGETADGTVETRKGVRILPEADPWEDRQLSLFDLAPEHTAVSRLKRLDPNRLTPLEGLAILVELKRLTEEE